MKYFVLYWIWFDVPFQLQLKTLTHMVPQKNLDKFFIQTSINVLKENFF